MLAQVLIAEADAFVAQWKDLKLPDGRDRVVRHGHGPQRAIQTGVGPVEVRRAKVRDRAEVGAEEKIRFTSSILPHPPVPDRPDEKPPSRTSRTANTFRGRQPTLAVLHAKSARCFYFVCTFFHMFTGEIGPSGVSTLLPVHVIVSS